MAKNICYQMLLAVDHLHTNGVIHRYLDMDDFLVRLNMSGKNLEIKLASIGKSGYSVGILHNCEKCIDSTS